MKKVYVIVWMTNGFQDLSVFTSFEKANNQFDELMKEFGLTEKQQTYYLRQAFGKGSLTLMSKITNFCTI